MRPGTGQGALTWRSMPEPSPPSASTDARVLREQVAALYATMPASTAIDVLLAWGLCALLYWQTRDGGILIWLGLHFIQVLRYPLIHAYFRDPHAAERSAFWAWRPGCSCRPTACR